MNRIRYFVNHRTRMCQMLTGPENGAEHQANIAAAIKDGFVEVGGPDEFDAFRAVTKEALDSGWKPTRMRYDTWLKKKVKL